jgi:Holliday junction resolvase RusA-like endonuclease
MTPITFDVLGVPAPQAGMRAVNTAKGPRQISTGGRNLTDWRNAISTAARTAHGGQPAITTAVHVTVSFFFPMPKSRTKKQRALELIPKTTAPDCDKLQRAVGDSLTAAGVISDDALIYAWFAQKWETTGWTGASISIDEWRPATW